MAEDNKNYMAQPPHDELAESALIGSMFLDREATFTALQHLSKEDFYRPDHGMVFDAIAELYNKANPIDIVTVQSKLSERGQLDQVGGVPFLANLSSTVGHSRNIKHYISIVEEKSILRKLIRTSGAISGLCYEGKESIEQIIEQAGKNLSDIVQNRSAEDFHHIRQVAAEAISDIEEIYNSQGKLTGIATGFIDFDTKTAGLQKADLILLAARPSMGKTAFALNIIQNAAIRENKNVAVFSLEMKRQQLVNRMLCSEAMVDAQKLRTGDLNDQDWEDIVNNMGPLTRAGIYIDDSNDVTPMYIRSKCKKLNDDKGVDLVVIDYLQLIEVDGHIESRQQAISQISRSLKALAREIDAPIIALSQLSRACEQRADHRPMLSDLRESGAIEQDADVVSFLYRDEYYFPDTEKPNQAELIIAKQRNGPVGTVELHWDGKYTKFGNLGR